MMGNAYAEEAIARQAFELAEIVVAMRGLSSRDMARALNALGIKTWEGRSFDTRAAYSLRRRVQRLFPVVLKRSATGDKLSTVENEKAPRAANPKGQITETIAGAVSEAAPFRGQAG